MPFIRVQFWMSINDQRPQAEGIPSDLGVYFG